MTRKILAAILACAMLLAVAVPALAATDPLNPTMTVSSTTKAPVISVLMPTEPAIVLNPYKLKVTVGTAKDATEQIVSPVLGLTNMSECPIQVCACVSVKVNGAVGLAADNTGFTAAETTTTPKVVFKVTGEIADKAGAALAGGTAAAITAPDTETDITGFAGAKSEGATIPAAAAANTMAAAVNGKAATSKGAFNFQFTGEAAVNSAITWTAKDTVIPTVKFKFIPLAEMPT